MRKHVSKQIKPEKAIFSLKKILIIALIFIVLMGTMGVMATNEKVKTVKILLSSGYEMNVVTTSTKVSDILSENHVIVLDGEIVTPDTDTDLSDNNTITISKSKNQKESQQEEFSAEEILKSYTSIVEKILTEQVEIPYETVTKDISDGSDSTQNKVTQLGENGLKEVTYKIRYQNGEEIEKTVISENVIKDPVDKIVEVRTKQVTSRSSNARTATSYGNGKWSYSAEELDLLCAITAQEASSSYEASLAVITCACNRAEMDWGRHGTDPLSQYEARGQFCYSIDSHWKKFLNGKYASTVEEAVTDALNGKRNHTFTSFRSAGHASGVNIGGNVYF